MTATTEIISVEQIPFESIENSSLGIPRDTFMCHPQVDEIIYALTHLTCGHSMLTPVIDISQYTANKGYSSARFSLQKNDHQQLEIKIYPITKQIRFENEFNLDNMEIEQLYRGELLSKEVDLRHDGKLVDSLLQLIPDTNLMLVLPKSTINIPQNLGQVQQTDKNTELLKNGGQITITHPNGEVFNVQLCLYSSNMITVSENFDRLRQQSNNQNSQAIKTDVSDIFTNDHDVHENTPIEERTNTGIKR